MQSGALRLHLRDWGNHRKPPLLLLHGGRDHCRSWDFIAPALCADWHVIAPDWRGHGDSDSSPEGIYTLPWFLRDLHAILATLPSPPVLVGHSLGGNIALHYAAAFPNLVARLVVIEGLGMSPAIMAERAATGRPPRLRAWLDAPAPRGPRLYPSVEAATLRLRQEQGFLTEALARHLAAHGTRAVPGGVVWKYDPRLRSQPPDDFTAAEMAQVFASVACPTLLAYGTNGFASNPVTDGRAAHFRDATLRLFDGCGHWLHHEAPADFIAVLREFLDR